jgi:hypothetical protein
LIWLDLNLFAFLWMWSKGILLIFSLLTFFIFCLLGVFHFLFIVESTCHNILQRFGCCRLLLNSISWRFIFRYDNSLLALILELVAFVWFAAFLHLVLSFALFWLVQIVVYYFDFGKKIISIYVWQAGVTVQGSVHKVSPAFVIERLDIWLVPGF